MKKITPEILRSWKPCSNGYKRFLEILPNGGTLKKCIDVLIEDGHDEWGEWLFNRCRETEEFKNQTLGGNQNSGNQNSGYRNSGNRNSGDWNSGDWNSGYRNSGDWNSGNWNSGDQNSGNRNSGNQNSGNWNSGYRNSGFFNTITPDEIFIFNKWCKRKDWEACYKPKFLYFSVTIWISEEEMTDQQRIDNPKFYVSGGYLKTLSYKEAFKKSWDNALKEDRELLFKLPNFDADIFLEISGIDVREFKNESTKKV